MKPEYTTAYKAAFLAAHELGHLEQEWKKRMIEVVKVKGLPAEEIVAIVQEMSYVQGRLIGIRAELKGKAKEV